MNISIHSSGVSKKFNDLYIFKNLSFSAAVFRPFAITGPNGSGKSTLLEIISGARKPTDGILTYIINSDEISIMKFRDHMGFSSPKIIPYRELTALENMEFINKNNNINEHYESLLNKFSLYKDRKKRIKHYSSGMLQRLRFIFAIMNDPHVLLLDEPGANLDTEGKDSVFSYLDSVKGEKLIIIATNDREEVNFCVDSILLKGNKKKPG